MEGIESTLSCENQRRLLGVKLVDSLVLFHSNELTPQQVCHAQSRSSQLCYGLHSFEWYFGVFGDSLGRVRIVVAANPHH